MRTYGLGRILCLKSGTFFKKDPIFLFFLERKRLFFGRAFWTFALREEHPSLSRAKPSSLYRATSSHSPLVPEPIQSQLHLSSPRREQGRRRPRRGSASTAASAGTRLPLHLLTPPSGTHPLARAAPVWFVQVRGIGQGLSSFIRWMDVCRFSVDLAPGDV